VPLGKDSLVSLIHGRASSCRHGSQNNVWGTAPANNRIQLSCGGSVFDIGNSSPASTGSMDKSDLRRGVDSGNESDGREGEWLTDAEVA
jgi:hypothetical protein